MPTIKLTKREVDAIPFAAFDKQQFYWDSELKVFGSRVEHKTKTFIVQRDINGKSKR